MRLRSRAGRKPAKPRRRKTVSLKRRNAPKAARGSSSSVAGQETKVARLTRELHEALEQQTATADVLRVISSSPGELEPVFQSMLANAVRICQAQFGFLHLHEDGLFRIGAIHNAPPALTKAIAQRKPLIAFGPLTGIGRVAATKQLVHIADYADEPAYKQRDPTAVSLVELGGARTLIVVPMLKHRELIGTIAFYRQEVRPFSDRQIELVQNFAAQALIAIENTRLLNELRQRTDDLAESLEQQTATSEVLSVISSSPGELGPVFQSMLANATKLCEASYGTFWLCEGDAFRVAALHGALPAAYVERLRSATLLRPGPQVPAVQALITRQPVQVSDMRASQAYLDREPLAVVGVEVHGIRTLVAVPMFKDDEPVGVIGIYRKEMRPFTDKQIDLVRNFAAQAVIAIENTRLLTELRQRTSDLTESLEQQTATADVLRVISSSPGELEPVFHAMLEKAVRVCDATFGLMYRYDGNSFEPAAWIGIPPALIDFLHQRGAFQPPPKTGLDIMLRTRAVVRTTDDLAERNPGAPGRYGGARSTIIVPMFKDKELVGAIGIYRQEVRPFSDKQTELISNFAAQAVIAIENTRLLNELRQSLEQQTATADILRVISQSPTDARPVFDSIVLTAARLLRCDLVIVLLCDGATISPAAGASPEGSLADLGPTNFPIDPGVNFPSRAILDKKMLHLPDWSLIDLPEHERIVHEKLGVNSALYLPLLREGECIGLLTLVGKRPNSFGAAEIAQAESFRDQALIAIENTRLFNELRQSLEQQTATAEVLRVISSSPGQLDPVFRTMLENATRICEANFGVLALNEGENFHVVAMHNPPPAYRELREREPVFRPDGAIEVMRQQAVATKRAVQVADISENAANAGSANASKFAALTGARSVIVVPMLKDDELIGVFNVFRQEVRPFDDKQVELLTNFAAQAVIAIENTRLLNELRQSLEQQTATSDVLRVISSSPGELELVFRAMLENAIRICDAKGGTLWRYESDAFEAVALCGAPPALTEFHRQRGSFKAPTGSGLDRMLLTKDVIRIADEAAEPTPSVSARLAGARSLIVVPMLKDNQLIGGIDIYRHEVRPFTEKQIELVRNFAAQAVIAIENTRLLNELKQSLQQQTATADVLKVISRSTFDLKTVLQTLVESAARLCDADRAAITREKNGAFYRAEAYGFSREFMDYVRDIPIEPERGSASGRALLEGRVVHIADVKADPEYTFVEAQRLGDFRTIIGVPMLREGAPVGVLTLTRSEVRPFTDKQIELVSTFADQAAIAIENVRLFESVEARTRELAKSLEDLRSAQDRLVQTEKLASLGQLTAGIAHEIKNPLNFVNNFSAVSVELIDELRGALGNLHLDDKVRGEINEIADTLQGNLDKVVQHGKRADAIVKNMLLHSRHGSGEHRPVDINALVEESLNLAYHGARAEKQGFEIALERSFDPAAGQADVFPQEITRALLNLISNGFYAATKRKTEANGGNYEPTLAAATKNLGDSVEIRIRDNGTGISPEVREKLFNPFFTTKPAGEGTGLGLSISHDIIVKQHGGSIEVDTEPGEFTEFRIVLPRVGRPL